MPKAIVPSERSALLTVVDRSIRAAIDHLLSLQHGEGYWWGELESNVTITAEHMFLTHILGIADPEEWRKIANYILSQQRDDGTWANWYEGPADLSTTIEAYLALKLAGIDPEDARMRAARGFILKNGGVERARIFTKIWLAILGEWDWSGTPMMPPEIIFLPSWFPISIYDFACWARGTVVPMTIIQTIRPVFPLPKYAHIDELYVNGKANVDLRIPVTKNSAWSKGFRALDRILRIYDRSPIKPGRKAAIRKAERWIVALGLFPDRPPGARLFDGSSGDA